MAAELKERDHDGEAQLEYVHMYYAHQYERMAKLEDQRLMITNIVISLSVLALSLAVTSAQTLTLAGNVEIHVLILLANSFAIAYVWRSQQYARVHQDRAKAVLERYAPELAQLDKAAPMPGDARRWGLGRLQLILHTIFVFLSIVSIYLRVTGG